MPDESLPIRVVVVDDHEMFAESVARSLDRAPDIEVVAIAGTCASGAAIVRLHQPDVAVVDFQLPDGNGADLTTAILGISPNTRVIVLTGSIDEQLVLTALDAGAAGFLTKEKAVRELVLAVRSVQQGQAYVSPANLAGLLPRLRPSTAPTIGSQLTPREREVLQLLVDGTSNDGIAKQLVLSKHTVRNHVQNVLAKLSAHSKLEAVAIAVRERIVVRG